MKLERKNMLILALFPYADRKYRSALRKLADQKGVDWLGKDVSHTLHDLLGSIIRHKDTHYENCVAAVGKERARFFIQGEINRKMKEFKGGSDHV